MALTLYHHPLSSFCHKVLIALYENGTDFQPEVVDLGDPVSRAPLLAHWPVGKIPVLWDGDRQEAVPETSIIIEYLEQYHPGPVPLVPADPAQARAVRLWDRFFDLYVNQPMGRIVVDRLRPAGGADPIGVAQCRETLQQAYGIAERHLTGRTWVATETFSMADCAALPALFYADIIEPFSANHPQLAAYFERLLARPACARVLVEARPWLAYFPYREAVPARFLDDPA